MDRFWTYCLSLLLGMGMLQSCHSPAPAPPATRNPELAAELFENGLIFRQASEAAGARLDSILRLDPELAGVHWEIFARDLKIGNYVRAFHHMDEAVRLDPKWYQGDRGSMRLYYLRDYEGAISDYQQALEISGHDPLHVSWGESTRMCLAIAHYQVGDYSGCRKWIADYLQNWKAAGQDPGFIDPYAWHFQGLSHYREGDYGEALNSFDISIQKYDRLSESWFWKAWSEYQLNRRAEACQSLRQAEDLMAQGYARRDKYRQLFEEISPAQLQEAKSTICPHP